ncbi:tryptophan halogenase family protein [Marinimicrobium sp. LS-A18]|uniref:tryptophan halogenase family protein n=1 Tax=Marinimicrobium sp. LS-A18 TaxID=1381596 RepID=UPI000464644B|nr:tryptophan halogenase family protein [Marinimicrobium sp. LS-A18]
MSSNPLKKVVIVGGGTAGWITAAALSRQLGNVLDITLIESDLIGTIGVGESTVPPIRIFHKLLGIDEQSFMKATAATFKLGIEFNDWYTPGSQYMHSFGKSGKDTWLGEFHHFWMRANRLGISQGFSDHSLEMQAAKSGRFGKEPQAAMTYAYHLDSSRYATFLRTFSTNLGVKRIEGKVTQVVQADNGHITTLELESGQHLDGDLFIDCTGFSGLLIDKTLNVDYEDWSQWLLCDSAVTVQTEAQEDPLPYTQATAHPEGWRWQIPLQHRLGNGLVYSQQHLSQDAALERLQQSVSGKPLTDPKVLHYKTGRRRQPWYRNCVAIGLSSGFIEPLESTSIHLIITAVTHLMKLFPYDEIRESHVRQYNDLVRSEVESVRDFIILHYHLTKRDDSPFWRSCKAVDIPDSLAHRIELFKSQAHVFQSNNDLFSSDSWVQVMLGQGVSPQRYHPIADVMTPDHLQKFITGDRNSVQQTVRQLPSHQSFLDRYCAMDRGQVF